MKKMDFVWKKKRIKVVLSIAIIALIGMVGCAPYEEGVTPQTASVQSAQTDVQTEGILESLPEEELPVAGEPAVQGIMKVHFIDVGQADCILIEADGHFMLVDAGNNDDAETVTGYLQAQGVSVLDYAVGTHPHEDHIGSLDTVINTFAIGTLIMPEKEHTTDTFFDVLDAIESKGLEITLPEVGQTYGLGSAVFTVVAPNRDYGDTLNNWSVGIKLEYGQNSFVFCGDAEKAAEKDIAANAIDLKADVLKVGHHGSDTSSTEVFLNAVVPKWAVISVGKDNDYGHPATVTLAKLKGLGTQIFRTDEQGTVIAVSEGNGITWNVAPVEVPGAEIPSVGAVNPATGTPVVETPPAEEAPSVIVAAPIEAAPSVAEEAPAAEPTQQPEAEKPAEAEQVPQQEQATEVTVHITKTGEKYHSAGCRYLSKSDIPVSLGKAKEAGYTPCSVCRPPQ